MKYGCESINGGANTVASSACWTRFDYPSLKAKEIVAYCIDNLIAIVDISQSVVSETLRGHSKRVNALKSTKHFLVSASEDATVQIWNLNDHGKWEQHAILSGVMRGSIITLTCLDSTSGLLIAATDVTGRVVIWLKRNESNIFSVIQVVDMPPSQMPHDLHFAESPGSGPVGVNGYHTGDFDVLLFLGGVDSRIHIRTASQRSISNSSIISNTPITANVETSSEDVFKMVGVLAGHEEWVTCLASVASDNRTLLLSSGSKDAKIRIWRLHNSSRQSIAPNSSDLQQINDYNKSKIEDEEEEEEEVDEIDAPEGAVMLEPDESLSEARLIFDTPSGSLCSVFLEALLIGHEDWVTSVHWMVNKDITVLKNEDTVSGKKSEDTNSEIERSQIDHRLYSTSMDRNMVIWASEVPSGIWSPTVRVGDVGGQLGGSVGGNLLGFVGGCQSPDSNRMLGIGYGGSFHLWCRTASSASDQDSSALELWAPKSFLGGHFESVNDLTWSPDSSYVITASSDQTCRLYAPLQHSDLLANYDNNCCDSGGSVTLTSTCDSKSNSDSNSTKLTHSPWREISRPQIHGYDLHSIAVTPSLDKYLIYSGADEKVLRVFDAPSCVIEGLTTLCGRNRIKPTSTGTSDSTGPRVTRAYIPELGLSNRASETMSNQEKSDQDARNVQTLNWTYTPLEGQLADYTVWPEVQKLYGHNNGVVCVAISHCGRWLASACKARDRETAAVLIWDINNYCCTGALDGHDSTVVCLAFSPNDKYLASSGKDRALCISIKNATSSVSSSTSSPSSSTTGNGNYSVATVIAAAHKRIVWAVSWCSDGTLLASGSRDGMCKIWSVSDSASTSNSQGAADVSCSCLYSFSPFNGVAVTAVAFGPCIAPSLSSYILALGAESGDINYWDLGPSSSTLLLSTESNHNHGSTVKKLAWSPQSISQAIHIDNSNTNQICDNQSTSPSQPVWRIASCGEDHTVRIYRITQ